MRYLAYPSAAASVVDSGGGGIHPKFPPKRMEFLLGFEKSPVPGENLVDFLLFFVQSKKDLYDLIPSILRQQDGSDFLVNACYNTCCFFSKRVLLRTRHHSELKSSPCYQDVAPSLFPILLATTKYDRHMPYLVQPYQHPWKHVHFISPPSSEITLQRDRISN